MRPRAGTHPVTLEPSAVVEIMTLARRHDEMLKETRQDLFRAETKLGVERAWRWPIRAACVALGGVVVAAWQYDGLRDSVLASVERFVAQMRTGGAEMGIAILAGAALILGLSLLIRKWISGPTPEERVRKLMKQFASADGVAAYVFSPQDNADDEAALVGALARPENNRIRQRRLTSSNRLLTASLAQLLNRPFETDQERRLRQIIEGGGDARPESA